MNDRVACSVMIICIFLLASIFAWHYTPNLIEILDGVRQGLR